MADEPGRAEGFLSRWSRRKTQTQQEGPGQPVQPGAPRAPLPAEPPSAQVTEAAVVPPPTIQPAAHKPAPAATPTMADVEALTPDSDFKAFTSPQVDPQVRNAALKKLFHSDPHFNVMDGLDVYIDDYSIPDPLPRSVMRQMLQARAMGLLDDELKDQERPEPDAPQVACGNGDTAPSHEDPDLQLQPQPAAGPAGLEPGADPGGSGERPGHGQPA